MHARVLLFVAIGCASCDKKPEPSPTPANSAPSASAKASTSAVASASASASPSVAGACAALMKSKSERCNKLSAGDPTIKAACEEGLDKVVAAGDAAKCEAAANPPPAPSGQPFVP